MPPLRVAILGAGGFAREVHWFLRDGRTYPDGERVEVVGFVDRKPQPAGLRGLPVWTIDDVDRDVRLLCAIGGMPEIKERVVADATHRGFRFTPPIVSEGIRIGPNVSIGEGTIVCPGSVVTVDIALGRHVAVNYGVTVGHDTQVGDFCMLSPGANVSGRITLERSVFLGTGCSIIEGLRVGAYAVVAAGAAVIRDVPPHALVAGVPAVVKKERREAA